MGILKGFRQLVVSFDVFWLFYESLSFEHHCIKESYFVLWYFGHECYCWVECVSLVNETLHLISFTVPTGETIINVTFPFFRLGIVIWEIENMYRVSIKFYIKTKVILAFWLVLAYDLLEDRCTIDVIVSKFFALCFKMAESFENLANILRNWAKDKVQKSLAKALNRLEKQEEER